MSLVHLLLLQRHVLFGVEDVNAYIGMLVARHLNLFKQLLRPLTVSGEGGSYHNLFSIASCKK